MSVRAVDIIVMGQVQGVFFLASCADQAERLGITGWIANLPDGSVSGHFEGSPGAVDELVTWCRHGPRRAAVAAVDVEEVEPRGGHGFEVR